MAEKKYQMSHSAKEIDEKLSAVLPFVELETVVSMDGSLVTCTKNDSEILAELAANKFPFINRAKIEVATGVKFECAAVFSYVDMLTEIAFGTTLQGIEVIYKYTGGAWVCSAYRNA